MRKFGLILILAVLWCLLPGCVDDSYRGTFDVKDEAADTPPIPIWMMVGEPTEIIADPLKSKGTGLISGAESFSEKCFYVYAFNQDYFTSMESTCKDDPLRCLIDGSLDDPETLAGRAANWSNMYERVAWVNGEEVYWPDGNNQAQRYDFFAYYVDDMVLTNEDFHRNDDEVIIDVEIDGSQDLMSSKASTPVEDLIEKFPEQEDREDIQRYCYSYFTAMNGIHPEFVFKHHLVKFDFKVVPGETPGKMKEVTINKVELRSKYKASFVVADSNDPSKVGLYFEDEYKRLPLAEADGSPFKEGYVVTTLSEKGAVPEKMDIGGSLLVAPGTQYTLYLSLSEMHDGKPLEPHETEVVLYQGLESDPTPFAAGNEYTVTLTVFGMMDVDVSTQLGKWEAGGSADAGTDQRPGTM